MTDIEAIEKSRFCLNLIRYLMAQNPRLAEYQLQLLKSTLALGDEVKKGNWIIAHNIGNGARSYIIVTNGQPMTTDNIPEWALSYPQKYVDADVNANPKEFLDLLKNVISQFDKRHQPITMFLSDLVSVIEHYYQDCTVNAEEAIIIADLCNSASTNSNAYSEILFQEKQKLISKYDGMKIPGDSAIIPLCIIDFLRQFQNKQLQENLPDTITTFIRNPQHNFLLNPEASARTVHTLYHTADLLKNAAQKEYTFFAFYKSLYEALLFYRSALYLGTLLIKHGIDDNELQHIVYMSEEMRVIIWLSIMPIYRSNTPDFLMPEDIFAWLGIITDKKQQSPDICPPNLYWIHNNYSSLCYPEIYKDIAVEVFKISRKISTSTKKLKKYACKLEEKKEELVDEVNIIDFLNRYIKIISKGKSMDL